MDTYKYKRMLRILFKMPYELSDVERKTQILLFIPVGLIIVIIYSSCLYLALGLSFIINFASLCIVVLGIALVFYYWNYLDKKYSLRSIGSPYPLSYQSYVIFLTVASLLFFFGMLSVGLAKGNFWWGVGSGVAVVYPILFMFLRIKTFNDKNIPVGGGFGFMPLSYWILSWALGFYTVGRGFSGLNFYLSDGSVSLEFVVISIIIGLVVQSVVLFPDKIDRLVPLDLRTKKGFIFMIALAFILFGLSQFLIMFINALIS